MGQTHDCLIGYENRTFEGRTCMCKSSHLKGWGSGRFNKKVPVSSLQWALQWRKIFIFEDLKQISVVSESEKQHLYLRALFFCPDFFGWGHENNCGFVLLNLKENGKNMFFFFLFFFFKFLFVIFGNLAQTDYVYFGKLY